MNNKIIQSIALITALSLQGANAADVQISANEKTATVQYFEGQKVSSLSYDYQKFSRIDFHEEDSLLSSILVEVSLAHTRVARAFGVTLEGYVEGQKDYGIKGGPSRIAINFAQGEVGLVDQFDKVRQEKFGKADSNRLFGYRWTLTDPESANKYDACISFGIDEYEKVNVVFEELARLSGLSDANKAKLTEVYAKIEECVKLSS